MPAKDCNGSVSPLASDEEAVTDRRISRVPVDDRCTRSADVRGVRRRQSERPLDASPREFARPSRAAAIAAGLTHGIGAARLTVALVTKAPPRLAQLLRLNEQILCERWPQAGTH